jgi:hypothetical protein
MEGWMNRRLLCLLAAVALGTSACSDNQLSPDTASAPALAPLTPSYLVTLPTECASPTQAQRAIDQMVPQLFLIGGGRWITAVAYNITIQLARRNGNTRLVKNTVQAFINFTLQTYYAGNVAGGQTPATQAKVLKLIYLLYCSNGITPIPDLSGIFGPTTTTTVLITNTTPTTTVAAPQQEAAVKIDQGDVPTSVFGTFVSVVRTSNPLPTSLDWYGLDGYKQGAFEFVANPAVTFTSPVTTGVCVTYDPDLVPGLASDLRLAHQVEPGYVPVVPGNKVVTTQGGTIEIGAPVSTTVLGLDCSTVTVGSTNLFGRMMQQFARLVLPPDLLASGTKGGTGSQVVKFSPFAAVDTRLALTSSGPSGTRLIPVGPDTATVSVTVRTRHPIDEVLGGQTPISGVTVAFAPGASFSFASRTTGTDGTASSLWTLVPGLNTATATPTEAPLTFDPALASFSVNMITDTPIPYSTGGYSYLQITSDASTDFSGAGSWPTGTTPFKSGGGCAVQAGAGTNWSVNTDLLLQKSFLVPSGWTGSVKVDAVIDNDIRVFVNGHELTDGFATHEGCPSLDAPFTFTAPNSFLIPGGTNVLTVRARDRGSESYVNLRVRLPSE